MKLNRRTFGRGLGRAALAGAALASPHARAAVGGLPSAAHGDSSPEWEKLRATLFGQRPIEAAASKVQLIVPLRAAYGASVPVKIVSRLAQTAQLRVLRMTVLVDKNPSPVAAVLELGTELGQADFETRLRVDEYSHIRVVSELSNGELHTDSRYVKVSGGCSAPPNRDQLHNLGKTVFRLPGEVRLDEPTPVDVQVVHPNDTGFELNNVTVMFIPPHFVRSLKVSYDGRRLFDAELDFSISENPAFRFNFVPHRAGELRAEVEDSKDGRFVGTLAVDPLSPSGERVGVRAALCSMVLRRPSPPTLSRREREKYLQRRVVLIAAALAFGAAPLLARAAGLPKAYNALVIEPTLANGRAEFDLGPALARARSEGKWLYVYLGASDCPYCRKYEAFLDQNAAELAPHFAKKYLLVDLRSALSVTSKMLHLKVGAESLPYAEFQQRLGDERARMLVYPSVWLLDGTPKPLMQMPAGTGTFQTVEEQLEILQLVQ